MSRSPQGDVGDSGHGCDAAPTGRAIRNSCRCIVAKAKTRDSGLMKSDLAGGQLPSGLFGANAAWWTLMILALNLSAAMKRLVLGKN